MLAATANVISYASIEVPTHRPKTFASSMLRWIGQAVVAIGYLLRYLLIALAYTVIFTGNVARLLFHVTGALLLLLSGVSFDNIRARLMRGAHWVDHATLRAVRFVTRNPFLRLPAVR